MKTVFTTTIPKQVPLLEMALRGAGIDYQLDNANAAFTGEIGPISAIPVGFLVRDEDVTVAAQVIEDALRRLGEWPKKSES